MSAFEIQSEIDQSRDAALLQNPPAEALHWRIIDKIKKATKHVFDRGSSFLGMSTDFMPCSNELIAQAKQSAEKNCVLGPGDEPLPLTVSVRVLADVCCPGVSAFFRLQQFVAFVVLLSWILFGRLWFLSLTSSCRQAELQPSTDSDCWKVQNLHDHVEDRYTQFYNRFIPTARWKGSLANACALDSVWNSYVSYMWRENTVLFKDMNVRMAIQCCSGKAGSEDQLNSVHHVYEHVMGIFFVLVIVLGPLFPLAAQYIKWEGSRECKAVSESDYCVMLHNLPTTATETEILQWVVEQVHAEDPCPDTSTTDLLCVDLLFSGMDSLQEFEKVLELNMLKSLSDSDVPCWSGYLESQFQASMQDQVLLELGKSKQLAVSELKPTGRALLRCQTPKIREKVIATLCSPMFPIFISALPTYFQRSLASRCTSLKATFYDHWVWAQPAPDPSEVLWENVSIHGTYYAFFRRCISFLIRWPLVLFVSGLLCNAFFLRQKTKQLQQASFFENLPDMVALNALGMLVSRATLAITMWEGGCFTVSELNRLILLRSFDCQMNASITPLFFLPYALCGAAQQATEDMWSTSQCAVAYHFSKSGTIDDLFSLVLCDSVMPVCLAFLRPNLIWKNLLRLYLTEYRQRCPNRFRAIVESRYCLGNPADYTQGQWNDVFSGDAFDLPSSMSALSYTCTLAVLCGVLAPSCLPAVLVGLGCKHVADRFGLLRCCCLPCWQDARLLREALGRSIPKGIAYGTFLMLSCAGSLRYLSKTADEFTKIEETNHGEASKGGQIFVLHWLIALAVWWMFSFHWKAACCARACLRFLCVCCREAVAWFEDEEETKECSTNEPLPYVQAQPLFKNRFRKLNPVYRIVPALAASNLTNSVICSMDSPSQINVDLVGAWDGPGIRTVLGMQQE